MGGGNGFNMDMGNQPSRQPGNAIDFSSMMGGMGGNPFSSFGSAFGQPQAPQTPPPASNAFDMSAMFGGGGANNLFASFGGGAPPAAATTAPAQKEVKERVTNVFFKRKPKRK